MLLSYLNYTIYGLSTIWFSSFSTQTLAFCSAQRNHGGSLIESVSGLCDAISAGVSRGSLIEECKWSQGIKHANEKECVWISAGKNCLENELKLNVGLNVHVIDFILVFITHLPTIRLI